MFKLIFSLFLIVLFDSYFVKGVTYVTIYSNISGISEQGYWSQTTYSNCPPLDPSCSGTDNVVLGSNSGSNPVYALFNTNYPNGTSATLYFWMGILSTSNTCQFTLSQQNNLTGNAIMSWLETVSNLGGCSSIPNGINFFSIPFSISNFDTYFIWEWTANPCIFQTNNSAAFPYFCTNGVTTQPINTGAWIIVQAPDVTTAMVTTVQQTTSQQTTFQPTTFQQTASIQTSNSNSITATQALTTNQLSSTQTQSNATLTTENLDTAANSNSKSITLIGGVIGGIIAICAIILLIIIIVVLVKKKNKHSKVFKEEIGASKPIDITPEKKPYLSGSELQQSKPQTQSTYGVSPERQDYFQDNLNKPLLQSRPISEKKSKWEIDFAELEIGKELGSGAYGIVYYGKWRGSEVAIKKVISQSEKDLEDFRQEFLTMKKLKNHKNIVTVLGITNQPFAIVTEFISGGNLLDLLQSSEAMSAQLRYKIMIGITAGMVHLEYEEIVHRDLAARNVLLTKEREAKISDFGMSRSLEGNAAKKTKSDVGPLKWMAPESLAYQTYSSKSDVWAWAVTMWELYCRKEPYPELDSVQAVLAVRAGTRLPIPTNAPKELEFLLKQCWETDPAARPTFKEIFNKLEGIKITDQN